MEVDHPGRAKLSWRWLFWLWCHHLCSGGSLTLHQSPHTGVDRVIRANSRIVGFRQVLGALDGFHKQPLLVRASLRILGSVSNEATAPLLVLVESCYAFF